MGHFYWPLTDEKEWWLYVYEVSRIEGKKLTNLSEYSYKLMLSDNNIPNTNRPNTGEILFCVTSGFITAKIEGKKDLDVPANDSQIFELITNASRQSRARDDFRFLPDEERQLRKSTLLSNYVRTSEMEKLRRQKITFLSDEIISKL